MAGVTLPDESSVEYVPALKQEYMRLFDEQANSLSVVDQVKAMEVRLQDRMIKQMEDMESSFKLYEKHTVLRSLYASAKKMENFQVKFV